MTGSVALAALAALGMYAGIPLAMAARRIRGAKPFLEGISAGILLFLVGEMGGQVVGQVEAHALGAAWGEIPLAPALLRGGTAVVALLAGVLLLEALGGSLRKRGRGSGAAGRMMLIALGIGVHNLTEGIAIGQAYAAGVGTLAASLGVGFSLHNATEAFAFLGALEGLSGPGWGTLLAAASLGGLPAIPGAYLGGRWTSPLLQIALLCVAVGAILQVVVHLIADESRTRGVRPRWLVEGVVVGLILALASEVWLDVRRGGAEPEEESPPLVWPSMPPNLAEGRRVYEGNCRVCHGAVGDGRGPAAPGLVPPPRDFTNLRWVVGETDLDWFRVVTHGRPGTAMAPWGAALSDRERWAVVDYLREFSKVPTAPPP